MLAGFFIVLSGLWIWWLYDTYESKSNRRDGAHGGADWEMTLQEYADN
jgi:hypothetical protein